MVSKTIHTISSIISFIFIMSIILTILSPIIGVLVILPVVFSILIPTSIIVNVIAIRSHYEKTIKRYLYGIIFNVFYTLSIDQHENCKLLKAKGKKSASICKLFKED